MPLPRATGSLRRAASCASLRLGGLAKIRRLARDLDTDADREPSVAGAARGGATGVRSGDPAP